jgi:hypothetical protein
MKVYEVTTQAKITKVMPNQSAEIDNGDGTKTVVDLKKNPQALASDPESGKLKLNTQTGAKPGQPQKPGGQGSAIKPGATVELDNEAAPATELFKGLHIEVRQNPTGGFDVVDTGVNGLASPKIIKSYNNVEAATAAAKMLDAEDMKVATTMSPSIRVQDDRELESMRRIAGLR